MIKFTPMYMFPHIELTGGCFSFESKEPELKPSNKEPLFLSSLDLI